MNSRLIPELTLDSGLKGWAVWDVDDAPERAGKL